MSDTTRQENKMGVMPIPKLLVTMSLPMIISMLVQALYNIVDSIFVAQLNEEALTAVSLAFPVQNLLIAVSVGTGVGINSLLSRHLGGRRFHEANLAARNGIFLEFMSFVVFAFIGGLAAGPFFRIQTDNTLIAVYGAQYMRIITTLSVGVFMQVAGERLLQATGKTIYAMITQAAGAIINIILDPVLIFGLFGFPRLEVVGAALATVTGQIAACILAFYFNITKNKEINISMKNFHPNLTVIGGIYQVGIPTIIMQSIGSVMTFGMNKILMVFTSTATAVFGVYFKLQSFIFMPIFGWNNGMVPIIAYNYGAHKKQRIMQTIKVSVIVSICIMAAGMVLFQCLPAQMLQLFDASDNMLQIGIPALRIISLCFIFAGYNIIVSSVFQALGNGIYSMFISVVRQLFVILPVAYVFSKLFGLTMVWSAIPIAEIAALILSTLLLIRIYRREIKPLDNE